MMIDKDLFSKFLVNPTSHYRRSTYGDAAAASYLMTGEPWFMWAEVPVMKQNPAIKFGLRLSRTPYSQYRLIEKDEAKAKKKTPLNTGNPKADAFVRDCFKKLFAEAMPRLIDSYHSWGRFSAGVEWRYDRRNNMLRIKKIRYVEPFDTDPQLYLRGKKSGQFAGFRLIRTGGYFGGQSDDFVGPRHAFYFAGHEQKAPLCDQPRIAGATTPWKELTSSGGALGSRRLSAFTRAVGITEIRYTPGVKANSPIDGSEMSPQDCARFIAERVQNGFVATMPNTEHPTMKGEFAWQLTQRQAPGGGPELEALINYCKQLHSEMWLGMDIPEEVFQTGDGGGSWSGKSLPMESWYGQHDEVANMIWANFREQHLDRAMLVNFNIREWAVDLNSLLQDFREQSKPGFGGQGGGKPADPNAPPKERGPDGHFAPAGQGQAALPANPQQQTQPGTGGANLSGVPALAPRGHLSSMTAADRQHHAGIAMAMIDAKLREMRGQESPQRVHDLIHWLPHLAHQDEMAAFRDGRGVNLAWIEDGTSRGGKKRWLNPDTKERRYQESEPGSFAKKREEMRGNAAAGLEIAKKVRYGEHGAGDLEALESHVHAMTEKQLRQARRHLDASFGNQRKRADLVKALTAHVRERMDDARTEPLPEPTPTARKLTGAAAAGKKRADGTPETPGVEHVYTVDPKKLHTDPTRFQYKAVGIGKDGVTDELKGTSTWNPELGGTMLVWRDPDNGQDYVINGHHRHELAMRTKADKVNTRYIDAPNAVEARARGALANIAEGRGTATDAAKYLRDSGQTIDHLKKAGVSMSGKVAADAANLADLSPAAFQKVAQGEIPEAVAVSVAKHLKDPKLQDSLFRILAKREEEGKQWGPREIETAAKKMAKAGTVTKAESTLFGDFEDEDSTFPQEVELESHIGQKLGQKVADFHAVSNANRAERVKGAGNVLAVDENLKQRDAARGHVEDFERMKDRKGPIADAVKAGAAKLALAKTGPEKTKVKNDTLEHVRSLIEAGTGTGLHSVGGAAGTTGAPGGAAQPVPPDAGAGGAGGGGTPGNVPAPSGGGGAGTGAGGDVKPPAAATPTPAELHALAGKYGQSTGWERSGADRLRVLAGELDKPAGMRVNVQGALEAMGAYAQAHNMAHPLAQAVDAAGREVLRRAGDRGDKELRDIYGRQIEYAKGGDEHSFNAIPRQVREHLGVALGTDGGRDARQNQLG